jgi:hypothetical protein
VNLGAPASLGEVHDDALGPPTSTEHLFISQHTVKTEAISIYRKLGVTSRSAAIDEARRLGLLSR